MSNCPVGVRFVTSVGRLYGDVADITAIQNFTSLDYKVGFLETDDVPL